MHPDHPSGDCAGLSLRIFRELSVIVRREKALLRRWELLELDLKYRLLLIDSVERRYTLLNNMVQRQETCCNNWSKKSRDPGPVTRPDDFSDKKNS